MDSNLDSLDLSRGEGLYPVLLLSRGCNGIFERRIFEKSCELYWLASSSVLMLGFFYGVGESSLMSFKHWFTSSSVPVWLKSFFLVTSHSHHDISLPLLFLYVLVHFFLIILSTISCMPSGSFFSNCWILSFMIHSWFSCESTQSSICAFAASPQLSD